jgi:hypothetical protein
MVDLSIATLVYQRVFNWEHHPTESTVFFKMGSRISGAIGNHKPAWEAPKKSLRNPY